MKRNDQVFYDTPGLIRRAEIVTLHRDSTVTILRGHALNIRTGEVLPGSYCGGLARIPRHFISYEFAAQGVTA